MRRRSTAAPLASSAPPRRLLEPHVEDFVKPGEILDDEDVRRAQRTCTPVDLSTRIGMAEAAASQRLADARADWLRSNPSPGALTIPDGRTWCLGAWRANHESRFGVGTDAAQWRDRAAWLAADETTVPW